MADRLAVYDVNDYIMAQLGSQLDQSGLRPIFPAQVPPEANALTGPFITYTCRTSTDPTDWWSFTDECNFIFHHTDISVLDILALNMSNLFRRMDDSAAEVNAWKLAQGGQYPDFTFFYFRLIGTHTPDPQNYEGERFARMVTIRYGYTQNYYNNYDKKNSQWLDSTNLL